MATFSGPLRFPPVSYVLCQVQFTPIPRWEDVVRRVHESLADAGFARQDERVQSVAIEEGGEPQVRSQQRVRFENREATLGYIVASGQLVTHQTSYTKFDDFCENIRRGFQTLVQEASIPFITRIGLRYIDLIAAEKGEALDDYVHAQLRAFAPELPGSKQGAGERQGAAELVEWRYPGSRVIFKAYRAKHQQPVPIDLLPVHLKFARSPPQDTESLILDIDHFVENIRMPPDWLVVGEQIRQLQEPMSQIFRAAISEHAVRRYNRAEQ